MHPSSWWHQEKMGVWTYGRSWHSSSRDSFTTYWLYSVVQPRRNPSHVHGQGGCSSSLSANLSPRFSPCLNFSCDLGQVSLSCLPHFPQVQQRNNCTFLLYTGVVRLDAAQVVSHSAIRVASWTVIKMNINGILLTCPKVTLQS